VGLVSILLIVFVAYSPLNPFGTIKVDLPPSCAIEWFVFLFHFSFKLFLSLIIAYTLGEKPPKS
jgi:hypothetical protein